MTNDVIAFSMPNTATLLDIIPLAEVVGVETIKSDDKTNEAKSLSESTIENAIDFTNAFYINTKQSGYNAGRKYFLRAGSDDILPSLVSSIRRTAQAAVQKAERRSLWDKMQERVRALYNSDWFQGVATFLIMAVRAFSFLHTLTCAPIARLPP